MSSTLNHQGYDGSLDYSAEDKMLHGRVIGIHDVISFGGQSVK
jgi:predicted HicB family RNase H-like nuclease